MPLASWRVRTTVGLTAECGTIATTPLGAKCLGQHAHTLGTGTGTLEPVEYLHPALLDGQPFSQRTGNRPPVSQRRTGPPDKIP